MPRPISASLIVAVQSFQAVAFGGIALFLPLIRGELDLDYTQSGLISLVGIASYAAMQIPAGILVDRVSPRLVFLIGALGTNLASLGLALLGSFPLILVDQAVSGVFRALMFAPGMLLMRALFAPDRQATAVGLYVVGGVSSNVILNLVGPLLVGPLGWRWIFVIFAGVGILVVALYAWVGDRGPLSSHQRFPTSAELLGLVREPVLVLSSVLQFVRYAVVQATGYWWPSYLVVDKGMSLQTAGLLIGVGALLGAPSNLLGGYIADRTHRPLWVITGGMVVLMLTLLLIVNVSSFWPTAVAVLLSSSLAQVYFGPLFDLPMSVLDRRFSGFISGFSNMWANVGGLLLSFLLGLFKDTWGSFSVGIYALAGLCLAGALIALLLGRILRRRRRATATAVPTSAPGALEYGAEP